MGYQLSTARRVLHDAELALVYLEQEEDAERFRLFWVAGVALSRTVGHVLSKVESARSDVVHEVIKRHWSEWKSDSIKHKIFYDFIEDERNRLLKEYELGFLDGEIPLVVESTGETRSFLLDNLLYCPIKDGVFAGEDCRDVLKEGIDWWKLRLQEIEDEIDRKAE